MIKHTDLKHGNVLKEGTVSTISKYFIVTTSGYVLEYKSLHGVKLDATTLKRYKFKSLEEGKHFRLISNNTYLYLYEKGNPQIIYQGSDTVRRIVTLENNITFLHELQNLWNSLTGRNLQ